MFTYAYTTATELEVGQTLMAAGKIAKTYNTPCGAVAVTTETGYVLFYSPDAQVVIVA